MRTVQYELCEAARAGDRARFDQLFDSWLDLVYGAALRRSGERVRAETLTHDLLVGAIQVVLARWSEKPDDESTNEPRKIAAAQ
jgi:DNA-directed RNA polymerase specialized sigma24 family protein